MEIDPVAFRGAKVTIKSQRCAGWMLFDLAKGYSSKGQLAMHVVMDISARGHTGTMEMTMKMKVTQNVK